MATRKPSFAELLRFHIDRVHGDIPMPCDPPDCPIAKTESIELTQAWVAEVLDGN